MLRGSKTRSRLGSSPSILYRKHNTNIVLRLIAYGEGPSTEAIEEMDSNYPRRARNPGATDPYTHLSGQGLE